MGTPSIASTLPWSRLVRMSMIITSSCQKINALAILLTNLMRAAVRMTTLLICNLAAIIQLKDDGHEDSADLLCDRLPIVLLARYRLHNQLCNFKHLCSASKLYKSYSI